MQWLRAQEYVSFGLLDAFICHDERAIVKCLAGSSKVEVKLPGSPVIGKVRTSQRCSPVEMGPPLFGLPAGGIR
jgi:hypothetical protein